MKTHAIRLHTTLTQRSQQVTHGHKWSQPRRCRLQKHATSQNHRFNMPTPPQRKTWTLRRALRMSCKTRPATHVHALRTPHATNLLFGARWNTSLQRNYNLGGNSLNLKCFPTSMFCNPESATAHHLLAEATAKSIGWRHANALSNPGKASGAIQTPLDF